MPSFAMTVPYMRTSPLHIPRRDLVLAAADSLYLRVTVVDSDSVCAQAIELSGGIGGPSAQFIVWPDTYYRTSWDYGARPHCPPPPIWVGTGTISDAIGAFDFSLPSGTMSSWPRRTRWAVQLNYDTTGADVLMAGILHVRMLGKAFSFAAPFLETDTYIPITTDILEPVLA